ncbi:MAG: hypothetical protein JWR16_1158, partial [Nevskia sp.]|nr:hypothetical protein [Nevskia sp.]
LDAARSLDLQAVIDRKRHSAMTLR